MVVWCIAARAERRLVPSRYCVAQKSVEIGSVCFVELVHGRFHVVVAYLRHVLDCLSQWSNCRTCSSCTASSRLSCPSMMLSTNSTFSSVAMFPRVMWWWSGCVEADRTGDARRGRAIVAGANVASTTGCGDCGLHVLSETGCFSSILAWWGNAFHKLSSAMELAEL